MCTVKIKLQSKRSIKNEPLGRKLEARAARSILGRDSLRRSTPVQDPVLICDLNIGKIARQGIRFC